MLVSDLLSPVTTPPPTWSSCTLLPPCPVYPLPDDLALSPITGHLPFRRRNKKQNPASPIKMAMMTIGRTIARWLVPLPPPEADGSGLGSEEKTLTVGPETVTMSFASSVVVSLCWRAKEMGEVVGKLRGMVQA